MYSLTKTKDFVGKMFPLNISIVKSEMILKVPSYIVMQTIQKFHTLKANFITQVFLQVIAKLNPYQFKTDIAIKMTLHKSTYDISP